MGTLEVDSATADSDLYFTLGLQELRKGVLGSPRVLTLLSSHIEKSVQKNETISQTTQIKDIITIFHGLRAPTVSIQQYIERIFKLLITSIMVAAKFIDDAFFNNAYYAKVGGVSTAELNRMEMKFLFGIDFRLQVSIKTFRKYCSELEKQGAEEVKIAQPIQPCRIKYCSHR